MLHWRPLPWGVGAGLFALVAVWTFVATPRYRSEALLQVSQQRTTGLFSEALAELAMAPIGARYEVTRTCRPEEEEATETWAYRKVGRNEWVLVA